MTNADPVGQPSSKNRQWLLTHGRTILLAVLLALGIRTGLAQAYLVEGPSMEPTLANGQRVLVVKFPYGLTLPAAEEALVTWATPDISDVVILASPLDGTDLVKRVVGLPGDVIEIHDDVVIRNGRPLATGRHGSCGSDEQCEWFEEAIGGSAWLTHRSVNTIPDTQPPVLVPEGQVYVLGDHRDRSNDSRYFGTVAISRLRGKVAFLD
jgi:signal peptidase I